MCRSKVQKSKGPKMYVHSPGFLSAKNMVQTWRPNAQDSKLLLKHVSLGISGAFPRRYLSQSSSS